MISYSTNWMGPIDPGWYEERGIDPEKDYWSGGRIDIYGLDETEYYGGRHEYSLPIMDGVSWNRFSDWLENYETIELKTYEQLLSAFEADTDNQIRWAHEEFRE
jgi:hypothetical protein